MSHHSVSRLVVSLHLSVVQFLYKNTDMNVIWEATLHLYGVLEVLHFDRRAQVERRRLDTQLLKNRRERDWDLQEENSRISEIRRNENINQKHFLIKGPSSFLEPKISWMIKTYRVLVGVSFDLQQVPVSILKRLVHTLQQLNFERKNSADFSQCVFCHFDGFLCLTRT